MFDDICLLVCCTFSNEESTDVIKDVFV